MALGEDIADTGSGFMHRDGGRDVFVLSVGAGVEAAGVAMAVVGI